MAFEIINPSEYDVGKAIRADLFRKIKVDLDDLDTRVSSLSTSANKTYLLNDTYSVIGEVVADEIINTFRIMTPVTVGEISLESYLTSGTGLLTIDVLKHTTLDSSFATSILTTPLVLNFTSPDYQKEFALLNPSFQDLAIGDYLFVKILTIPLNCNAFRVSSLGIN